MQAHAWICDSCGLDRHTPMARADPPDGWRIVVIYGAEDEAAPPEQHYCSPKCANAGPLPPDEIHEARSRARAAARLENSEQGS